MKIRGKIPSIFPIVNTKLFMYFGIYDYVDAYFLLENEKMPYINFFSYSYKSEKLLIFY
jgi:hypothetical protein